MAKTHKMDKYSNFILVRTSRFNTISSVSYGNGVRTSFLHSMAKGLMKSLVTDFEDLFLIFSAVKIYKY